MGMVATPSLGSAQQPFTSSTGGAVIDPPSTTLVVTLTRGGFTAHQQVNRSRSLYFKAWRAYARGLGRRYSQALVKGLRFN
jgi:hypothetical protein